MRNILNKRDEYSWAKMVCRYSLRPEKIHILRYHSFSGEGKSVVFLPTRSAWFRILVALCCQFVVIQISESEKGWNYHAH